MFDFWTLFFFVFGTLWGSFSNVVIYRLPRGESVIFPRSHCPFCKTTIAWYGNIPLFSWFFLRGRCTHCGQRISLRYPFVEGLMGVLFAYLYRVYGFSPLFFEYLIFSFGLVTVSFIDLDHMILPDSFTLSGIAIGLLGAFLDPQREFFNAFLGFLLGGGFLFVVAYGYFALRGVDGMGGGDIKLIAWIGAVCGWKSLGFVVLTSSFLGILFGVFYMIRSKEGLKTGVPFGPYLSMAALLYILFDVSPLMNVMLPPFP